MGVDPIVKAVNRITRGKYSEIHSLLIYRNGMLVFEEYFQDHQYQWDTPGYYGERVQWNREMTHPIICCTNSFISAFIGIAIDKGFIDNVHQSIFDYLPDYQFLNVDNREYITIEHLLTMTSVLAWDEWSASHGTAANDIDRLYFECPVSITCVQEKPWWREPGQLLTYNEGGMIILRGFSVFCSLTILILISSTLFPPGRVQSIVNFMFDIRVATTTIIFAFLSLVSIVF
jgi:hypothetical protein